ncbi:MAG TPA: L-threonylcarbamoyladenylate synthase [Polyangiaceae bacterium]|nr:L-threonylcarbamoyladenylate synthase [Polyangiaceae bacterium]
MRVAKALLEQGKLVAFPTETVYGLGANALDAQAVLRIFEAKGRPQFDPLIVHADSAERAFALASEIPEIAKTLAERFWPGPLTLVLKKRSIVPDLVTSGLQTVALRVPAHPMALELLRSFGGPIAAPSANKFGRISPTNAEHVRSEFGDEVALVLDGGSCRTGVESTIIALTGEHPVLLRPGGTPIELLTPFLAGLELPSTDPEHPLAPGQLPSHYAPRTPLVLARCGALADSINELSGKRLGWMGVGPARPIPGYAHVEWLSHTGDLRQAASNLFATMRRLDALSLDCIVAELAPEHGLGLAINDRLIRASRK